MLISVSCKNFKSVKDNETISFDCINDVRLDDNRLVEINDRYKLIKSLAIIGPNGAGKSTMARVLEALKCIVTSEDGDEQKMLRKFFQGSFFGYGETKGMPSILSIDFVTEKDEIIRYRIMASHERIYSETLYRTIDGMTKMILSRKYIPDTGRYRCSFGRAYEGEERRELTRKLADGKTVLQRAARLGLDFFSDVYSWFDNVLDVKPIGFSSSSEKYFVRMMEEHPDWKKKIVDFLWSCDITDVKDVMIRDGHALFIHTNALDKRGQYFDGESFSLRRLVTIGASIFEAYVTNKTMVFDDFGMMLHPLVVQHCARLFEECSKTKRSQLIVIDCNPSLLKDGLLRRDGIYFAEKTSEGCTRYYSLADYRYSLRRLDTPNDYLNGAFGALPLTNEFKFDK